MLQVTISFMRKQLFVISVLAAFVLTGCKGPQVIGGVPPERRYQNIVSLSPSTTEILSMIGASVKGRTKACNFPTAIVNSAPIVCDLKPNYEDMVALKTDFIVFDKDLFSAQEIEKMKQTKADVFEVSGDTLQDFYKSLYTLASKIGYETAAQDFINKIEREVKSAGADVLDPKPKAAVILPGSNGKHYIAGVKSFQADIVRIMGAEPVGPDSNKFEPLNPEFLVSQNPAVIYTAGKTAGFTSDTRFAGVDAVKNQRMIGLEQDIVLRRGARIENFIKDGHRGLLLVMNKK